MGKVEVFVSSCTPYIQDIPWRLSPIGPIFSNSAMSASNDAFNEVHVIFPTKGLKAEIAGAKSRVWSVPSWPYWWTLPWSTPEAQRLRPDDWQFQPRWSIVQGFTHGVASYLGSWRIRLGEGATEHRSVASFFGSISGKILVPLSRMVNILSPSNPSLTNFSIVREKIPLSVRSCRFESFQIQISVHCISKSLYNTIWRNPRERKYSIIANYMRTIFTSKGRGKRDWSRNAWVPTVHESLGNLEGIRGRLTATSLNTYSRLDTQLSQDLKVVTTSVLISTLMSEYILYR